MESIFLTWTLVYVKKAKIKGTFIWGKKNVCSENTWIHRPYVEFCLFVVNFTLKIVVAVLINQMRRPQFHNEVLKCINLIKPPSPLMKRCTFPAAWAESATPDWIAVQRCTGDVWDPAKCWKVEPQWIVSTETHLAVSAPPLDGALTD